MDGDNDGLLGAGERKGPNMSTEQFTCLVKHVREAALASGIVRQSDLDLYPREEVEQGLTYYEYIAWQTDGYTTCRDCNKCVTCELTNPPTASANTRPPWDCSVTPTGNNQKKACAKAGCDKSICRGK